MNFKLLMSIAPVLTALVVAHPAMAASFTSGDIFASGNGVVKVYDPSGSLLQTLSPGGSGVLTGSASDHNGNFYVTDFGGSNVYKFNSSGVLQGKYGSGYSTPEDILFDASGNGFVDNIGGSIKKFNSSGALLTTFNTPRTDWFDINASETIAYYTDESGAIHRWNLSTNTSLSDFAASGGQFAIRLLANGDVLAASFGGVTEFSSTGSVLKTYMIPGTSELFALNLDPNGTSFWTGDVSSGDLFKVDISSGAIQETIATGDNGGLYGVSVAGEITQVTGGGAAPEPASIFLLGGGLLGLVGLLRRVRKA